MRACDVDCEGWQYVAGKSTGEEEAVEHAC